MGLSLGRSCRSCTATSSNAPAPNPNPGRFKLLEVTQIGVNVVVKVKYLDCTNFEGIKICLYRGISASQITQVRMLDPHFSEIGLAPFARFEPSPAGELAAQTLAQMLK